MAVLLERPGRRSGQLVGRSPYMQAVHVAASRHLLGRVVPVRIDRGFANSLAGTVLDGPVDGGVRGRRPADHTREAVA